MAPRKAAVKKQAKATASASKGESKRDDEAAEDIIEEELQDMDGGKVDQRALCSRFPNFASYRADPTKNQKGEGLAEAQQALQVCGSVAKSKTYL